MLNDFTFGNGMQDFGRDMLREVVRTDYGPNCSFNGIGGHGLQNHHGGLHDQVTLYQQGISNSGINFRFFDK